MNFSKNTHDAPVITVCLIALLSVSVPLVIYILFSVWPESFARQAVATAALLNMIWFTTISKKNDALLLAAIFFSQFAVSLLSFELDAPVKFQIYLIDVIIFFLFAVVVEQKTRIRINSLGWLFLLLIGWFGVATYFSVHVHRSLIFMICQIKYFILFALFLNTQISEQLVKKIINIVALVILIQCVISVAQIIHGGSVGLGIIGEPTAENFINGTLRASGTITGTNAFAGYLSMLLVFIFPFVLRKQDVLLKFIFGFGVFVLLIALSRAGWLSFIVGCTCVMFMMLRANLVKVSRLLMISSLTTVIVLIGFTIYSEKILNRFNDRQAISSATGRIDQFSVATLAIRNHGFVGIGPGVTEFFGRWNNNKQYIRKNLTDFDMPNQVHNSQLQVLIESGVPGLVMFMSIIMFLFWSVLAKARNIQIYAVGPLMQIGGICAALAVMVHVSLGTEFNNQQIFVVFWSLLGLSQNKHMVNIDHTSVLQNEAAESL